MIPILVPSLLPGIALVYLFGTQGLIKELMFGHSIYGPIGIVIAEVFFTCRTRSSSSSPRCPSPTPGCTRRRWRCARAGSGSSSPSPCPAAGTGSSAPRSWCSPSPSPISALPRSSGGLQRPRHRRLQAGDRAAELRDGGGGERGAADSGGARVRRRPRGAAPAGRPALLARGGPGAEAEPHLRRRDARLLHPGERVPDRHARHVPVRRAREVLPLRPELRPAELRLRRDGRRRVGCVLELDPGWRPIPRSAGRS